MNHRDWVFGDRLRYGLRAQWRALFRTFDVGDLSGDADAGLST